VSSYNPFVSLYWLMTGKTLGGLALSSDANRLDRMEALRLWTVGSAWFSGEDGRKGRIAPGQLADLAVLSADYFSVPDDEIKSLESVLTLVGGRIVHASGSFADLAPPALPGSETWTPVTGGAAASRRRSSSRTVASATVPMHAHGRASWSCGCVPI
jgi:hypothetical protein